MSNPVAQKGFLLLFSLGVLFSCTPKSTHPVGADTKKTFPSAQDSDPIQLGWMQGSPPPEDKIIRAEDQSYAQFPQWRWSVCHFRQLLPSVNVSKGLANSNPLPIKLDPNIDSLSFTPIGSDKAMTWKESLSANYTDGIIVLHKGVIVYEDYFGALTPEGQHGAMSVTKSVVGTIGATLVAQGLIQAEKRVAHYLPELNKSAFADATVEQLLDMTTGIRFNEDYSDPNADIWKHSAAGSPLPKPADFNGPRSYYEFLEGVEPQGKHGEAFGYKTANTDALGWLISRVTRKPLNQLLSELIWSQIGAEQDAYFMVDSIGTPFAGGGFNAGLRDMARFGQMILQEGYYNNKQILPKSAIDSIRQGGDPLKFKKAGYSLLKDWSYKNMWWVSHNEHGAFAARGVYGQTIYIDPKAQMVLVRFASYPIAANSAIDPTSLPAYHSLAKYLLEKE